MIHRLRPGNRPMRSLTRWLASCGALLAIACSDAESPLQEPEGGSLLACSIPRSRIFNGGPGRDGIPSLTRPEVVPAEQSQFLLDTRVLGVEINGEARAYPLPIMWWHEVVNDTLGGEPVLVTYCPLTGSGLAFDPVVGGRFLNFGVSGLLFENNLIMFDRQTESLWNQLLLGAQCGPERDSELSRIPVVETMLGGWVERHPQTTVVTTNTGFSRSYGVYPYGNYRELNNSETLFPSSPWGEELPPKEKVLGIHEDRSSVAYPFGVLKSLGAAVALNDSVGDLAVLVTYQGGYQTARAFDRTVHDQTLTFSVVDSTAFTLVDAETGTEWNALGVAVAGPLEGSRLTAVADAYLLFWFSWSIYYPRTRVFQ